MLGLALVQLIFSPNLEKGSNLEQYLSNVSMCVAQNSRISLSQLGDLGDEVSLDVFISGCLEVGDHLLSNDNNIERVCHLE